MQKIWWTIKQTLWQWFALALVVMLLVCVSVPSVCRFSSVEGERVFYLQSTSSQGLRKEKLSLFDIFKVRGESVKFAYTQQTEEIVEEMTRRYGVEVVFTERVGDVVSYYGYTSAWKTSVFLYGKKINFHLAVRENTHNATMGTPIIFDGY